MLSAIICTVLVFAVGIPLMSFLGGLLVAPVLALLHTLFELMKEHKVISAIVIIILLLIAF